MTERVSWTNFHETCVIPSDTALMIITREKSSHPFTLLCRPKYPGNRAINDTRGEKIPNSTQVKMLTKVGNVFLKKHLTLKKTDTLLYIMSQ